MARIRTIKPEFWSSPAMAGLDPWVRLLYIAMWNWADDSGRGTANPRELGGFAFPNDEDITSADIRRILGEVRRAFGVVFYEVGGRPYYWIPSWDKHQKIDKRSLPKHPAPEDGTPWNPDPDDDTFTAPDQHERRTSAGSAEPSGESAETPPNPPGTLGAGIRNRGTGEIGTEEKETPAPDGASPHTGNGHSRKRALTDAEIDTHPDFVAFWDAYPRKTDKGHARKAWAKAVRAGTDPARITAGAKAYREDPTRSTQFTAHPATWLNGERWNDQAPEAGASHGRPDRSSTPYRAQPRHERRTNYAQEIGGTA